MNSQNRPDPQAPSSPQTPTGPANVKKTPAEQNSYTNETESPVKRPETYRELQEQLARKEKQKAASEEPLTQNDNGNEKENFDRNEETVTGISLADALPLALVLALIFALAWLAKRFLRGRNILGGSGTVKILDRTPISPKQSLILVKVGERLILVGVSQEGMTALSEIDDPEQVAMLMGEAASYQPGSISRSFSDEVEDHRDEYMQQPMSEDPVEQTRGQVRGLLDKVRRFANYNDVA
jgi:flagellar protein FliO/FliZ